MTLRYLRYTKTRAFSSNLCLFQTRAPLQFFWVIHDGLQQQVLPWVVLQSHFYFPG